MSYLTENFILNLFQHFQILSCFNLKKYLFH